MNCLNKQITHCSECCVGSLLRYICSGVKRPLIVNFILSILLVSVCAYGRQRLNYSLLKTYYSSLYQYDSKGNILSNRKGQCFTCQERQIHYLRVINSHQRSQSFVPFMFAIELVIYPTKNNTRRRMSDPYIAHVPIRGCFICTLTNKGMLHLHMYQQEDASFAHVPIRGCFICTCTNKRMLHSHMYQ